MCNLRFLRCSVIGLSLFGFFGCDGNQSAAPNGLSQTQAIQRQQLLEATAEAERAAANTTPPRPVIDLAIPPGWQRSEPRAMPPEDHGFTVAYEHESGLTVTLYQFTRGQLTIPDDLDSAPVKKEMRDAQAAIEQAVQLGYYQAAKQTESKTVQLGDSPRQALWSQFHLTVEGNTVNSDIYIWSQDNTLFKLRCTSRSNNAGSNQAILSPLLTAFGTHDGSAGQEGK